MVGATKKPIVAISHPLIKHKISYLRDKDTEMKAFRELVYELSLLMAYEVTRTLETVPITIETPITTAQCERVHTSNVAIVPILRAGLGMVEGFQALLPAAKIGHIGLARNEETLKPEAYYHKLPQHIEAMDVIIVDPMLATGGSAVAAVDFLKEKGVNNIKFVALIAAPYGIETLQNAHPEIEIYIAQIDDALTEHGYITPGLGDAGDRIFGTQ